MSKLSLGDKQRLRFFIELILQNPASAKDIFLKWKKDGIENCKGVVKRIYPLVIYTREEDFSYWKILQVSQQLDYETKILFDAAWRSRGENYE